MKKYNTSQRLNQIMSERNLKQVDIINLALPYCKKYNVKLTKTDLSQYVNGKVEPGQNKLAILSLALNVSEAWLMGFDVPINRISEKAQNKIFSLSSHEKKVITAYRDKPDMQPAVDKLLGIDTSNDVKKPVFSHPGERIKYEREKLGISLEYLAQELDVSVTELKNLESGFSYIKSSKFFQLANILKINPLELVTKDDDPLSKLKVADSGNSIDFWDWDRKK